MSVIDASWSWAHSYGGVGVILTDPVETILVHLSVDYLDEARAVGAVELEAALGRRVELEPVTFHAADNNWFPDLDPETRELLPDFDRWSPLGGVGWLAKGVHEAELLARTDMLPERSRALCGALIRGEPSLSLCGGGRYGRATPVAAVPGPVGSEQQPAVPAPAGSEQQLAALLHDTDVDGSSWVPVPRPGEERPPEPEALWERARDAADRGEADTLLHLLSDARPRYSPAGWRLLRSGTLHLLALRAAGWLR
jgi:hypothetical protein